jgi:hypothetical protein
LDATGDAELQAAAYRTTSPSVAVLISGLLLYVGYFWFLRFVCDITDFTCRTCGNISNIALGINFSGLYRQKVSCVPYKFKSKLQFKKSDPKRRQNPQKTSFVSAGFQVRGFEGGIGRSQPSLKQKKRLEGPCQG